MSRGMSRINLNGKWGFTACELARDSGMASGHRWAPPRLMFVAATTTMRVPLMELQVYSTEAKRRGLR